MRRLETFIEILNLLKFKNFPFLKALNPKVVNHLSVNYDMNLFS